MSPSSRLEDILKYTRLAASTALEIADGVNVPYLRATANLSLTIVDNIPSMQSTKDEFIRMLGIIHEILYAIISLYATNHSDGVLPPALLYDIAKFTEALQKLYSFMRSRQQMGKIKQLFKQAESSARLQACRSQLEELLDTFRIQTGLSAFGNITKVQMDAKQRHENLLNLISVHDFATSHDSSSVSGLSSGGDSSVSLSLVPAPPQIFHGRESELHDILNILQQSSARIAILGTGGIGKTSLALSAVHHPSVVAKYSHIHFIACQSTQTSSDIASTIASHIGLPQSPNLSRKIIHHFTSSSPSLVVLDNFETPWEPSVSRPEVEDLLSSLTGIPHLAVMVLGVWGRSGARQELRTYEFFM